MQRMTMTDDQNMPVPVTPAERKRLGETKFLWVGGPLDGAAGPPATTTILEMERFTVWVGPDIACDPKKGEVVVYKLQKGYPSRAVYSAQLTKFANNNYKKK